MYQLSGTRSLELGTAERNPRNLRNLSMQFALRAAGAGNLENAPF